MKILGFFISITLILATSFEHSLAQTCASYCNNGKCIISNGVEVCECYDGFVGKKCDISDPCSQKPCINGACFTVLQPIQGSSLEQASYLCQCYYGFYGQNCEIVLPGPCSSNPCLNKGTCIERSSSRDYYCDCVGPYTGPNCGTYVDYCANNRCENGASCSPQVNTKNYTCDCLSGFYGTYCEKEINECIVYVNGNETSPCKNNGRCYDLIDAFICQCNPPWTGPTCEIYSNPCNSNPCGSDTICSIVEDSYVCNCKPGYFGSPCQLNPCNSNPCNKPGSKCIPIEAGAFPIIIPGCNITSPATYVCVCPGVSPEYGSQVC